MNYTKDIFNLIGVEPEEEFKLIHSNKIEESLVHKITKNLFIYVKGNCTNGNWMPSEYSITNILCGEVAIKKIPKITKEDQIVIDYAKLCGYKWLAKDADGDIRAYSEKPIKQLCVDAWCINNGSDFHGIATSTITDYVELGHSISFLSWEDDEPYYIGG